METTQTNQQGVPAQQSGPDYAAALRHYQHYHHGRSMRRYCEDEGYGYAKFCKYAREAMAAGQSEPATFLEVPPEGQAATSPGPLSDVTVKEVRIRLSNGVILSSRRGNVQEVLTLLHKMLA